MEKQSIRNKFVAILQSGNQPRMEQRLVKRPTPKFESDFFNVHHFL